MSLSALSVHLVNGMQRTLGGSFQRFQKRLEKLLKDTTKSPPDNQEALRYLFADQGTNGFVRQIIKNTRYKEPEIRSAIHKYTVQVHPVRDPQSHDERAQKNSSANKDILEELIKECKNLKENCDPVAVIKNMIPRSENEGYEATEQHSFEFSQAISMTPCFEDELKNQLHEALQDITNKANTIMDEESSLPYLEINRRNSAFEQALEDARYEKKRFRPMIKEYQTFFCTAHFNATRKLENATICAEMNIAVHAANKYLIMKMLNATGTKTQNFNFFEFINEMIKRLRGLMKLCEPNQQGTRYQIDKELYKESEETVLEELYKMMRSTTKTTRELRDIAKEILQICTFNFAMGGKTKLRVYDLEEKVKRGKKAAISAILNVLHEKNVTYRGYIGFIQKCCYDVCRTDIDAFCE